MSAPSRRAAPCRAPGRRAPRARARCAAPTTRGRPGPPARPGPRARSTAVVPCDGGACTKWAATPGRAAPRRCAPRPGSSARKRARRPGGSPFAAAEDAAERVVAAVDDALLERDDRVVGDVDALGADLGAALRDVAQPQAALVHHRVQPVERVQRMHLQARDADEEARPEVAVVHPVIAQDVADVLAQEALDALAELAHPVDVLLADRP